MAKIESDQTVTPGKEPAGHTADAGDGKATVAPPAPPRSKFPDGKDQPVSPAEKSAGRGEGKPPVEKPLPAGQPGNSQRKEHAKKSGDRGERKQPVDKGLPPRPGKPKRKARTKSPPQKSAAGPGGVGYRNPPIDTRFKPGESGNIKGRPLGAKNKVRAFGVEQLKETALAELYREIETTEGDEKITLPAATLILRKMVQKGTEGDPRAALIMLTMGQNIEREKKAEQLELMQLAVDHKKGWAENFAYCKKHDLPLPEVFPHPDHVIINYDTGEVTFIGPCSAEEKARVDDLLKRKAVNDKEISGIEADLRGKLKPGYRKFLQDLLADAKWIRGMIEKILPEWALADLKKPPAKE